MSGLSPYQKRDARLDNLRKQAEKGVLTKAEGQLLVQMVRELNREITPEVQNVVKPAAGATITQGDFEIVFNEIFDNVDYLFTLKLNDKQMKALYNFGVEHLRVMSKYMALRAEQERQEIQK